MADPPHNAAIAKTPVRMVFFFICFFGLFFSWKVMRIKILPYHWALMM
jgi:hypothetical protein